MRRRKISSLKTQIGYLICVVVLGIILACGYSVITVIHSNQAKYDAWCEENLFEIEKSYMEKYYKIRSIMSACEYNENLQRILSGSGASSYEILTPINDMETNLTYMLYNYSLLDSELMDVYVRDMNNRLYYYARYQNDSTLMEFIEDNSFDKDGSISDIFELGSSLCFAMTGEIHKFENAGLGYTISKDKVIGASIFTVKADFLRKEMEKIQGHGCSVYLLNQKGEVMLMPEGQEMLWEDIRQNISSLETAENGILSIQKKGYVINMKSIGSNGWKLLLVSPEKERIFYEKDGFRWLVVWLVFLLCVFMVAFPLLKSLNSFVNNCVRHMKEIGDGNLDAKLERMDKKEFNQITDGLNHMMESVKQLMDRNIQLTTGLYKEEAEKSKAMLFALQSQMNPHFLYNTIECIRNIGVCYDVKEIEELSTALSAVLRYSLRQENVVTIGQELECIKQFVLIQTIRFEDKFQVYYKVQENLMDRNILRLSLQPLVENAMKHGLEAKQGECILIIHIFEKDEFLHLQVEDNGVGIPYEKLKRLREGKGKEQKSVALSNLKDRLMLYYGSAAALNMESKENEGTKMEILIDIHEK